MKLLFIFLGVVLGVILFLGILALILYGNLKSAFRKFTRTEKRKMKQLGKNCNVLRLPCYDNCQKSPCETYKKPDCGCEKPKYNCEENKCKNDCYKPKCQSDYAKPKCQSDCAKPKCNTGCEKPKYNYSKPKCNCK